jgi:hypothetical protein
MAASQPTTLTGSLTPWGRILLVLLLLNGLGAFIGGIGVTKDALPFPDVWLQGTPFHSYFVPGLILCLIVGGSQLAAALALLWRHSLARTVSLLAGFVLTGWMIGELMLIGFRAPIQMWFLALGLSEVGLSFTKLRRVPHVVA